MLLSKASGGSNEGFPEWRSSVPSGPWLTMSFGVFPIFFGGFSPIYPFLRDAEMTIKIIFERSSQKGGQQGVRKEGQQGNPS